MSSISHRSTTKTTSLTTITKTEEDRNNSKIGLSCTNTDERGDNNNNNNTNNNTTTQTATSIPAPSRYIFTPKDLNQFQKSPIRKELISFVSALGRSCASVKGYEYDPCHSHPIVGLSPAMSSLHGSLRCMSTQWIEDIPRDDTLGSRFGNPKFRVWHQRLEKRSENIIRSMMVCHDTYPLGLDVQSDTTTSSSSWDLDVLKVCETRGYEAAAHDDTRITIDGGNKESRSSSSAAYSSHPTDEAIILELRSYFHLSFGHPIRIDYGTGHECCFYIVLYCLCKLGLLTGKKTNQNNKNITNNNNNNNNKQQHPSNVVVPPNVTSMAPVALSLTSAYLAACRAIQSEYVLEPAGSRGVWGLDDYHCIPFYIGACQLQNTHLLLYHDENAYTNPDCIHQSHLLQSRDAEKYIYMTCIRHIKSLKRGVPFFESSPMLDDISRMSNWAKISGGLLRLFEGEVLDKLPVVQHFLFGRVFQATWTPSEEPKQAPAHTFRPSTNAVQTAAMSTTPVHFEQTRAPWAK